MGRSRGGITKAKKETFPTHERIMHAADGPQQLCGCCVHANRRIRYNRKDLKNVHIKKKGAVRAHGTTTSVGLSHVFYYTIKRYLACLSISARMDGTAQQGTSR